MLRNIATGGVLVETSLVCLSKATCAARIAFDERGPALNAIVRHVSPATGSPDGGSRFLVGLEFVNVSGPVRRHRAAGRRLARTRRFLTEQIPQINDFCPAGRCSCGL